MAAKKQVEVRAWAWTIKHGRFVFIDYTRRSKRWAIAAYVDAADDGWTWKRLYASGARAIRVRVIAKVKP